MSMAQIYFPPLAWQLCETSASSLLDVQGWEDVTGWLRLRSSEKLPLYDLCPSLPVAVHPHQHPDQADDWSEIFADEICFIVESDNALDSIKPTTLRYCSVKAISLTGHSSLQS